MQNTPTPPPHPLQGTDFEDTLLAETGYFDEADEPDDDEIAPPESERK